MHFLQQATSIPRVRELSHAAASENLSNVFNPSIARVGDAEVVAFRAMPPSGTKPFNAYLRVRDPHASLTNLTAHAASFGVQVVADPKLVVLGQVVYATFNTGTPASGDNQIYLMSVYPTLGAPQRCVLSERNRIEKNWAFFAQDGTLKALYGMSPLTVINHVSGRLGDASDLTFQRSSHDASGRERGMGRLSIGTQPLLRPDGTFLFIAHEKFHALGKRAYVGRAARLDVGADAPELTVSRRRFAHSVRDLLPSRPRHNPNLFSATYFSGITSEAAGDVVLSYGVNDLSAQFAIVAEETLWS